MKDRKDFIDRFLKLLFGDRVSEVDSSIIVKLAKDPAVLKARIQSAATYVVVAYRHTWAKTGIFGVR